jgi:hypothetical protein
MPPSMPKPMIRRVNWSITQHAVLSFAQHIVEMLPAPIQLVKLQSNARFPGVALQYGADCLGSFAAGGEWP